MNALPDFDNELFLDNYILHAKIPYISYKYPAYRTTFRLMAENVIAPPGEFASLSHLKEDYFPLVSWVRCGT